MKKHILIIISLISVCMLSSCNNTGPTGPQGEKGDSGLGYKEITLPVTRSNYIIKGIDASLEDMQGVGIELALGCRKEWFSVSEYKVADISRVLLYFDTSELDILPSNIISANITVYKAYELISITSYVELTYVVYPVLKSWHEDDLSWKKPWDNPGGDYAADYQIGTLMCYDENKLETPDMPVKINLDINYVKNWLLTDRNYGVLIKYKKEQGVVGEKNLSNNRIILHDRGDRKPKLQIIYQAE